MPGCCARIPADADSFAVIEIDGHVYAWVYKADYSQAMKRIVCGQAHEPSNPLTWFDAADVTQSMTAVELAHLQMKADLASDIKKERAAAGSQPALNYEANRLRGLID